MDIKPTLSGFRLRVVRSDGTLADGSIRTNESWLGIGAGISNDVRIKLEGAEDFMCRIEIDKRSKVRQMMKLIIVSNTTRV